MGKQKMASLNNANYFDFPQAVLVMMNIWSVIEANPVEMCLLCVAAVIHWELENGVLQQNKWPCSQDNIC